MRSFLIRRIIHEISRYMEGGLKTLVLLVETLDNQMKADWIHQIMCQWVAADMKPISQYYQDTGHYSNTFFLSKRHWRRVSGCRLPKRKYIDFISSLKIIPLANTKLIWRSDGRGGGGGWLCHHTTFSQCTLSPPSIMRFKWK